MKNRKNARCCKIGFRIRMWPLGLRSDLGFARKACLTFKVTTGYQGQPQLILRSMYLCRGKRKKDLHNYFLLSQQVRKFLLDKILEQVRGFLKNLINEQDQISMSRMDFFFKINKRACSVMYSVAGYEYVLYVLAFFPVLCTQSFSKIDGCHCTYCIHPTRSHNFSNILSI